MVGLNLVPGIIVGIIAALALGFLAIIYKDKILEYKDKLFPKKVCSQWLGCTNAYDIWQMSDTTSTTANMHGQA